MKILQVSTASMGAVKGGGNVHVYNLSSFISQSGHDVWIASPGKIKDNSIQYDITEKSISTSLSLFPGDTFHDSRAPRFPDPITAYSLFKIIRKWDPDIVHTHGIIAYSVGLLRLLYRFKWVHTLHDYSLVSPNIRLWRRDINEICSGPSVSKCLKCRLHNYRSRSNLYNFLKMLSLFMFPARKALGGYADHYIAVSNQVRNDHQNLYPKISQKISVIHNSLPRKFGSNRKVVGDIPFDNFFLYVGYSGIEKGLPDVIRALEILSTSNLIIVTNDNNYYASDKNNNIHVESQISRRRVAGLCYHALAGVFPSRVKETFGMTALECLSQGTPAIVSNVGGLKDIVDHGITGFIVEPGSPKSISKYMRKILSSKRLRKSMGEAAKRSFLDKFTNETCIKNVIKIYRSVA